MKFLGLMEALSNKRNALGQTTFQSSQITDPHIQRAIGVVAQALGAPPAQVEQYVAAEAAKDIAAFKKAPLLYETIQRNIIESKVFDLLWKKLPPDAEIPNAAQFDIQTFYKLVRHVSVENDEFWPLRGFVDRRPLSPSFEFLPPEHPQIKTAAASPTGTFYFNVGFCQRLLDYAAIKQIKPQGAKYEANGGPFPDGYAYLEFLIMHEFMHYSNDDFYYQKIIPKANPKIINWVGDFRSNYLLVKSGFEQLPMGLYNDSINYDRQKAYIEMYRLVEEEMKKMSEDEQKTAGDKMDELSDDHEPGQQDGAASDQKIPGDAGEKIDRNAERIEKDVEDGKKKRDAGVDPGKPKDGEGGKGDDSSGQPGTGKGSSAGVDYSKVRPTFNWTQLLRKFVTSQKPAQEETYSRPARRGITGIEVARQTGAGAMKPGERTLERVDLKLCIVLDTSGSMSGSLAKIFANVTALLKLPVYKNSSVVVIQFSGAHKVFHVQFSKNQGTEVYPGKGNTTASAIFGTVDSGGTVVSKGLVEAMASYAAQGYNVLMATDADITVGDNKTNMVALIKQHARNTFILFNTRGDYVAWRSATGIGTANISHM